MGEGRIAVKAVSFYRRGGKGGNSESKPPSLVRHRFSTPSVVCSGQGSRSAYKLELVEFIYNYENYVVEAVFVVF